MTDYSFIRFHFNKESAQNLQEGPDSQINYLGQIQLKPNDEIPYQLVTNTPFSFNVGTYKVYLVDCKGKETEVTSYVTIVTFLEPGTILTQAKISILNLPDVFGDDLVYFKIERFGDADGGLKKYYSNKFLVSNTDIERTCRIDYVDPTRNIPSDRPSRTSYHYQSIRLNFYYHNYISASEVSTYYAISISQNINPRTQLKEYKQWFLPTFNAFTFRRFERALYGGVFYVDFVRNYATEAIKYKEREALSNISENYVITDPDEKDTLSYVSNRFLASSSRLASSNLLSSQELEP